MSLQASLPLYLEDQIQRVNKTSQEPSATVKVTDCRAPTCVCQSEGNRVCRREAREEMRRIYATQPITQLVYTPSYLFLKLIFTLVTLWKRNRPLSLQREQAWMITLPLSHMFTKRAQGPYSKTHPLSPLNWSRVRNVSQEVAEVTHHKPWG